MPQSLDYDNATVTLSFSFYAITHTSTPLASNTLAGNTSNSIYVSCKW